MPVLFVTDSDNHNISATDRNSCVGDYFADDENDEQSSSSSSSRSCVTVLARMELSDQAAANLLLQLGSGRIHNFTPGNDASTSGLNSTSSHSNRKITLCLTLACVLYCALFCNNICRQCRLTSFNTKR